MSFAVNFACAHLNCMGHIYWLTFLVDITPYLVLLRIPCGNLYYWHCYRKDYPASHRLLEWPYQSVGREAKFCVIFLCLHQAVVPHCTSIEIPWIKDCVAQSRAILYITLMYFITHTFHRVFKLVVGGRDKWHLEQGLVQIE